MTNSGGGDASDPLRPIGRGGLEGASRARGVEGAPEVRGSEAVGAVEAAEGTRSTAEIDAITEDLAAGRIDPATARARLIDDAIAQALPPGSDPALVADLRAELEAVLAADPLLDRLLTP